MAERVLILGGTEEARRLAAALAEGGMFEPVTALAGRTVDPAPVAGSVRVGGFGGPEGLAEHLRAEGYAALVDVTHPFARQISAHAAEAARATGVARLALVRPGWVAGAGDRWLEVGDEAEAAAALAGLGLLDGTSVFLALGRQRIMDFASVAGVRFLVRTVDPFGPPWPGCRVLVGRGPFDAASERALLEREGVAAMVCRNSGGVSGAAKLVAARALEVPVVMIRRPAPPDLPVAASVAEALDWLAVTVGKTGPAALEERRS
ncbi:cobalt-precorrin-6A reductase [Thalassobaculum sp.]|uniref:cobalt-precorrin-6A reductase n=1 Tax=Thalassobaculum sp. TaxID=2022740 RepID=UPI0032ED6A0A